MPNTEKSGLVPQFIFFFYCFFYFSNIEAYSSIIVCKNFSECCWSLKDRCGGDIQCIKGGIMHKTVHDYDPWQYLLWRKGIWKACSVSPEQCAAPVFVGGCKPGQFAQEVFLIKKNVQGSTKYWLIVNQDSYFLLYANSCFKGMPRY